jgi:hypothetical protein
MRDVSDFFVHAGTATAMDMATAVASRLMSGSRAISMTKVLYAPCCSSSSDMATSLMVQLDTIHGD